MGVRVDQARNRRQGAKVDGLGSGRHCRRRGTDTPDPVAFDDDDRVPDRLSLSGHDCAEAEEDRFGLCGAAKDHGKSSEEGNRSDGTRLHERIIGRNAVSDEATVVLRTWVVAFPLFTRSRPSWVQENHAADKKVLDRLFGARPAEIQTRRLDASSASRRRAPPAITAGMTRPEFRAAISGVVAR